MIINFFITLMAYPSNWILGFFPSLSSADTSTVLGNITLAIDYITDFMAIAMYVFPWYQTVMEIFGIWLLYNGAKFIIDVVTWVASSVPFSPVQPTLWTK